jgi:hypothetical protein
MNADDILVRVRRLDHLLRGLEREIPYVEKGDDPVHVEYREYLTTLRKGLVGVENALTGEGGHVTAVRCGCYTPSGSRFQ